MEITVRIERTSGAGTTPVTRLPDGAWRAREDDHLLLSVEGEVLPSATMGGEPLRHLGVSRKGAQFVSRFELVLLSFAGRVRVKLQSDKAVDWIDVDVSPREDKLGETAYREMLEELVRVSKDLPWGFSPAEQGALRDHGSPPVILPAVLEAELPPLLASLRRICADPLTWTERPRVLAPLPKNREVDPATFRWLLTHPRSLHAVRGDQDDVGGDPQKIVVQQRQRVMRWNHPATRTLKFELNRLVRALGSGRDGLRDRKEARAQELSDCVDRHLGELRAILKAPAFRDVQAEPPGQTALLILFDQPLYARVHKLLHRLLDPGLRLSDKGSLLASLRHSYDLFELLALYRLRKRLGDVLGGSWKWTSSPLPTVRDTLSGPENASVFRAVGPGGLELELHFQKTFHSWPSGEGKEFGSLSGERRPDYLLLLRRAGAPAGWVLLDAKYRSSRGAVIDALGEMHVYRDSLRWCGAPANAGFILVPALHEDARTFAASGYLDQHRFGALILDAADWPSQILRVLDLTPEVIAATAV